MHLIEPSDEIEALSAEEAFELLSRALPNVKIALLHGRMKGDEKVEVMRAFKAGEYQLLVPPPWSRSVSMFPTRPICLSRTLSGSGWLNCTNCAVG